MIAATNDEYAHDDHEGRRNFGSVHAIAPMGLSSGVE
jgi:hypothetical protein